MYILGYNVFNNGCYNGCYNECIYYVIMNV